MMVKPEQVQELLKPIDPKRVGKDGKGFHHVEAWDVRRTMNQIFGFGTWSADVTDMVLIAEQEVTTKKGTPAWYVVYRARCTLRLGEAFGEGYCSYSEWAAGEGLNPVLGDAHDMAIKTAESQAFKRCAVNLGDQFGLSLYKNGSTEATVGDVVGREYADSARVPELVEAFNVADSVEDLTAVAQEIPSLDLGDADKNLLRSAYAAAKSRLEAP